MIDRLSKCSDSNYVEETAKAVENDIRKHPEGRHVRSKSESGVTSREIDAVKKHQVAEAKLEQMEIRLQLKVILKMRCSGNL